MLRDLAEVKPGDPVVHSQHGIGRYQGLVTLDLGEGRDGIPPPRVRRRRQALRAGLAAARDQPLHRRLARGRARCTASAAASGRRRAQGRAAGARHRRRAARPLRAPRRAPGLRASR